MASADKRWNPAAVASSGLAVVVLLAIACWLLWPQRVELSPQTYPVAIALYRVCNQQDSQGLATIQTELDTLRQTAGSGDVAIAQLQSIIDQAEAGDWPSAMRSSRQALDDQSNHP